MELRGVILQALSLVVVVLIAVDAMAVSSGNSRRGETSRTDRTGGRTQYPSRGRTRYPTRPENNVDPEIFLERFGYLDKIPGGVQHSPAARREAIRGFQRMVGLKVTGKLDTATRKKMLAPRCGNPDVVPHDGQVQSEPQHGGRPRPENYYAPGYKWSKKTLTYWVENASPDMDAGLQRLAFANAFKYWSDVSPLTFNEVPANSPDADIKIKFGSGDHGDGAGNAFDQEGGVLAHAFYPEDGTTHFDEAETWAWAGGDRTTHLQTVAAHEFGHALGLGHSNVEGALMAPYYQGYDPNFKLHDDDISGIRSLYGRRTVQPKPKPTPRPRPRPTVKPTRKPSGGKPDSCTTKFGAILQAHDANIYVFNGKWLWQLNDWSVNPGYPKLARKVYQKAPTNIGAAVYSWRTRYTYFFKGNKIFRYYGFQFVLRKTVRQANYPTKPDAAFMSRDGKIYIFQGTRFWELDEYNMAMVGGPRTITSKWPGLPANIESAVRLRDGNVYFFKGSRYRKYDEYSRRVLPGYPKDKAGPFMGIECGGRYVPK